MPLEENVEAHGRAARRGRRRAGRVSVRARRRLPEGLSLSLSHKHTYILIHTVDLFFVKWYHLFVSFSLSLVHSLLSFNLYFSRL